MKPMCLLHHVVISLLAAGCATVGPDFVPPTPQAPAQWHGELTGGLSPAPLDKAALSQW
jgi:hypothetical protein